MQIFEANSVVLCASLCLEANFLYDCISADTLRFYEATIMMKMTSRGFICFGAFARQSRNVCIHKELSYSSLPSIEGSLELLVLDPHREQHH